MRLQFPAVHTRVRNAECGMRNPRLTFRTPNSELRTVPHLLKMRCATLLELVIVMTILGVLLSFGIPSFQLALEQSRAQVASANLESIWSAQRLYWLDNRTYASDVATLQSLGMLDHSLSSQTFFAYEITSADASSFVAIATCTTNQKWNGTVHDRPNRHSFGRPFQSTEVGHCGGLSMIKFSTKPAVRFSIGRGQDDARRGVSLIEVQVAMVTLGILLCGIGPISAVYIRQLGQAQKRFDPETNYYLVPSSEFWVRKLGVAASLTTQDPGSVSLSDPLPTPNTVLLESLQKTISSEDVTVQVDVQPTH